MALLQWIALSKKKELTHIITAKWKTEEASHQRKIKEKNRLISTKTDTDRKQTETKVSD